MNTYIYLPILMQRHYGREDYVLKVTTGYANHNKRKNELIICELTVINKRIAPVC